MHADHLVMYHRSVGLLWGHVEGIVFLILCVDVYSVCCKSWNAVYADGVTISIVLLAEINVGMMSVTVFCHICTFLCDIWVYASSTWTLLLTQAKCMVQLTKSLTTQSSVIHKPYFGPSFIFSAVMMVLHCREQFAVMQNVLASFKLSWYFGSSTAVMYIVWIWTTENVSCTNCVKLKGVISLLISYCDVKTCDWNYWMFWCYLFTSTYTDRTLSLLCAQTDSVSVSPPPLLPLHTLGTNKKHRSHWFWTVEVTWLNDEVASMRTEFKQCIQIPVQAGEKNHVFPQSHAGGFSWSKKQTWQMTTEHTAWDMTSIFWRRKAWKEKVLNIFIERTREGQHQWDERWNCYKDNTERTLRDGVEHTWGFPSA